MKKHERNRKKVTTANIGKIFGVSWPIIANYIRTRELGWVYNDGE